MMRRYDKERDHDALARIWREIGWLADHDVAREAFEEEMDFLKGWVVESGGEAECYVGTTPGTMRYGDVDLSMSLVGAVTTSRVARKRGLATRLTARAMSDVCEEGVDVAVLGMFEQGFYDRLGFGTGCVQHLYRILTTQLDVPRLERSPKRLGRETWRNVHANRMARRRRHGAVTITDARSTLGEMSFHFHSFGLGFFDGPDDTLSHHVWVEPQEGNIADGPYKVMWMAFETYEQLLELLSVLHSFDDQVEKLILVEPPGVRLQDFLRKPLHHWMLTRNSPFRIGIEGLAYWQVRICDVESCLRKTSLPTRESVAFNLRLTDPIESRVEEGWGWSGVGGDYVVNLGPSSSAEGGRDATLPTLEASVGAFSRMWLGVAPATTLAISDELSAPQKLLEKLDDIICLPMPDPDWEV